MASWWKNSVVYQIYPRSFMDANGDGIGDLQGIVSKLGYLKHLGVDVLWLSPVYRSPNDDNGYDISDYRAIMNEFGTMDDFDILLTEAHQHGLKIVMDLVVNHTSDEHPWFVESRLSKDNIYRDYYIWRDEPNTWESAFGGSAWQYDEKTSQYYLHLFSRKQPDLNWENQLLREEVYELMRFWLEKGIDGFRMDVINFISKELPNAREEGRGRFVNGPRIHEFLREMNDRVLSNYDIMTVGETPGVTPQEAVLYTHPDRQELNMVFQFEHMDIDFGERGKFDIKHWRLVDLKRMMSKWQETLYNSGWNSLYLNNHDQPRMVSRFGDDSVYRVESAKMLATFLHMQQGTPFIYQGEEIGMTNVAFASIDDYKDIETLNIWEERVVKGGEAAKEVLKLIHLKGRDNARTPVQWDGSNNAGFTTGTPWMKVNPNYKNINVKRAVSDPNSVFHYYRKLIEIRRRFDIVVNGKYELLLPEHEEIYVYLRKSEGQFMLVVCNFYGGKPQFEFPQSLAVGPHKLLISNYEVDETEPVQSFVMKPYEVRVYLFEAGSSVTNQ